MHQKQGKKGIRILSNTEWRLKVKCVIRLWNNERQ